MNVSRRDFTVAETVALGASGLLLGGCTSASASADESAVTRIGALQVWQTQNGSWKLLARQGFRLPA